MSGTVKLNSAGGGSISLTPASTASNVTATVPAATDTLVNLASSQSLSNKTITAANSNTVEATSGPASTQLAGQRNKIINGAMMIDQRNAGASVTVNNDPIYTVDRFCGGKGGNVNNFTVQQSTTVPTSVASNNANFANSVLVTMGAGVTINSGAYAYYAQQIEGQSTVDLGLGTANASPFTLSFWVRCSVTGTFGVSFRNNAATATYSATYAINAANTWEYKTVVVPAITSGTWLTNNLVGVGVMWDLGVGSSFSATAGQLNTGANYFGVTGTTKLANTSGATWYVTGVQLEKGATATPFENRLYGEELILCQRYYQINGSGCTGVSNSGGNLIQFGIPFKVPMRANATAALRTTSIEAGDAFVAVRTITSATIFYANTGYAGTDNGMEIQLATWATTANKVHVLYTNCVGFSAEL